jgi:hypothetical protein
MKAVGTSRMMSDSGICRPIDSSYVRSVVRSSRNMQVKEARNMQSMRDG